MISGAMFRDAVISASNNITNFKAAVDALNVFPVPDGDTGTNMALTMQAAAREMLKVSDDEHISHVADITASALLRGARGNSGVILSLIFKGIAEGLRGCIEASGTSIAAALQLGSDNAYRAVQKPVEGTILTLIRICAERAFSKASVGCEALEVFSECCEAARLTLKKTPEMLVDLRRAKVVDAGGQGLVYVFEGMFSVFNGGGIIAQGEQEEEAAAQTEAVSLFEDNDIKFAYCTEFIINKDMKSFLDALLLRSYLETIGDCVLVAEDNEIIKVHVHSNAPGDVLTKALEYGSLVNVKIDNMKQQHKNASWGIGALWGGDGEKTGNATYDKSYGFVAVCAGDGLDTLFAELGADIRVSGGQTMNPSTDEILEAVKRVRAEHVFVLPNNKNIIMAAEQAIPLAGENVSVLRTVNIPQGIAAMLQFDETAALEDNIKNMSSAACKLSCVQITYAARDSYLNGQKINEGDILGMENGKISLVDSDPNNAAQRCTRHLMDKNTSVITVFYGNGITQEKADSLVERIRQKAGVNVEVSAVYGGQPVYYYIISIE